MSDPALFEKIALWSQVAGAVAFAIVLVLLFRRFLIPAVDANERARNAELINAETRRDQLRAEAEKARAAISDAERDAQNIQARAHADAQSERESLLAEVQSEGERLLRNAEGELQRARFTARDRLRIEFIEKALAKARAEAAGRLDDDANERLVNETVETLVRGAADA
jgi:F0F1-type ATP synthase membrane subunit b/b'